MTVNQPLPPTHYYNSTCSGQSVTFTAPDAKSYQWTNGDTTASAVVSPDTTKTYLVTLTKADESTAVDTFTVQVRPSPIVTAGHDTTITSPATIVTLSASATGSGTLQYLWTYTDANSTASATWAAAHQTATIQVAPTVTTTYIVYVNDVSGCKASDKVTVTVKQNFPASNTFTICKGQSVTIQAPEGINYLYGPQAIPHSLLLFHQQIIKFITLHSPLLPAL